MELDSAGEGFAGTAFFARLYEEALALVRETRDYLAVHGADDARGLAAASGLAFSVETMRLTSRLAHIMAWLLTQRALAEGELEPAQKTEGRLRLGGADVCLGEPPLGVADLPPYLLDLLRRSERLFRRIQRLDRLVAQPAA
jgi:regulator of CtrA degradation